MKMTESALQVEIENLSAVKRKLRIVVPSDAVTQEVDKAYRDLGKKARVKGFRPGKAPRSVLELYYGKQIDQEVSDTLVRRTLGEALKDKDLEPLNFSWPEPPPQVVAGQDYHFSVELEVPPEFSVEDYKGLALTAPEVAVTDEEVAERLEEIRQTNALLKPPAEERGIIAGDFVVLDYQAFFGGQPVEGGKAEGTYMEVGKGNFNPEFEQNLLGLKPGTDTRFAVSLPQDFANPLLAGKVVDFQVKIHETKEKVVADLDDAFAQNLGGNFGNLVDLQSAVREDIIKGKERERQAFLENQVMDQLLVHHTFELPPSLVQQEQESIFREQWDRLQQHGVNLSGADPAKMLEAIKPMAERRARVRLLLERIAATEGMTVDDAELEATLGRIAVGNRRDVAEVKKFYQEHDLMEVLRRQLRDEKTMKLLLENAIITKTSTPVKIGGNTFWDVPIPLVFEGRFFHIDPGEKEHIFTVVTLSGEGPIVEVLRNEPKDNPLTKVTKNVTGIITVSDPNTGRFLYKIRPGSDFSSVFGRIIGEEKEIRITDREIDVAGSKFQSNEIVGSTIGLSVDKNGHFMLGVDPPQEIVKWLQEKIIPKENA